jgi:outer membrane protein assembly factor BamB/orotate phosphoribosyltransferase
VSVGALDVNRIRPPAAAESCGDKSRELLRRAIYERSLLLGVKPSFDFKELLTQASLARAAGRLLWPLMRPHRPAVLIGPGFGGAPLLYAIAFAALESDGLDLTIWMVRDQRKAHRRKRWVEGPACDPSARAVIVDDFLGQGSAIDLVEEALAADERRVSLCAVAVLFDHWLPLGSRQLSVSRFPVVSLFKRHDIGLTRDCHDARPPAMRGSAPPLLKEQLWWRFEFNGWSEHPRKASPAIGDGAVFAADDRSQVWRFDGATGEAVWKHQALERPYKGIVQRLELVDGSIVFGCYDGTVTRLDTSSGAVIWRWRLDSHIHATPEIDLARQRVFVNTEQSNGGDPFGHLYCLDWSTGKVKWRRPHGFWAPATAAYCPKTDTVIAAANDQSLICVAADTGELRWRTATDGLVRGRPAVQDGRLFVATERGSLQSFSSASGELVQARPYGTGLPQQFVHAENGVVYVLDAGGHLVAFDTSDLRVRWMSRLRSPGVCAPLKIGHYLVVLSHRGHLAVLDPVKERKVWEGAVDGTYGQLPGVGWLADRTVIAFASQHAGLKLFSIDSFYDQAPSQ